MLSLASELLVNTVLVNTLLPGSDYKLLQAWFHSTLALDMASVDIGVKASIKIVLDVRASVKLQC